MFFSLKIMILIILFHRFSDIVTSGIVQTNKALAIRLVIRLGIVSRAPQTQSLLISDGGI